VDSLQDGGASDAGPCIDLDGDGFGSGCGVADCDDGDPESTDECIACYDEKEGCLCTPGTAPLFCKPGLVQIGERTVLCNEGARYCRDGVWTECEPSLGG